GLRADYRASRQGSVLLERVGERAFPRGQAARGSTGRWRLLRALACGAGEAAGCKGRCHAGGCRGACRGLATGGTRNAAWAADPSGERSGGQPGKGIHAGKLLTASELSRKAGG